MFQKLRVVLVATILFVSVAAASEYPDYYPKSGFQRTGTLDAVQLDRQQIVINDVRYSLSNNLIVHSMSSYSVPATQLRPGLTIGYSMASSGRLITKIWLLPRDYRSPERR
jgi:hypothetical protein